MPTQQQKKGTVLMWGSLEGMTMVQQRGDLNGPQAELGAMCGL